MTFFSISKKVEKCISVFIPISQNGENVYEVCSKSIANFVFFKNYLFIHEYLFCPLQSNPHQILYTCANVFFQSFDAVFISLIVAERHPFMGLFSFGNKKKSQGADLGNTAVLFLAKNV